MKSPSHYFYTHIRTVNLLSAGLAVLAITAALIMQYVFLMEPCALCIVQRVIVVAIGVLFLIDGVAGFQKLAGSINSGLIIILALLGLVVAGRHGWLQHLPDDENLVACLPGLRYLLSTFSIDQVFVKVMQGSSECATEHWSLLGLSIPEQMFLLFALFLLVSTARLVLINKPFSKSSG